LPRRSIETIQNGTLTYSYKGVPTYKSPLDIALYQLLLWEQKPRTLIEIGSKWGSSALWFSDLLRSYGVDYTIHSIDIDPPKNREFPGVFFHRGDGRDLANILSADLLARMHRPLMVIEDADHRPATTLSVLRFFDRWLPTSRRLILKADGAFDYVERAALHFRVDAPDIEPNTFRTLTRYLDNRKSVATCGPVADPTATEIVVIFRPEDGLKRIASQIEFPFRAGCGRPSFRQRCRS